MIVALIASGRSSAWRLADPLLAVAGAIYILVSAWGIFHSSFNLLMDRELPEADRERIRDNRPARHPAVISVHDSAHPLVRHPQTFIQFHLEMDGDLDADRRSRHCRFGDARGSRGRFPNAEVLIHEDPYGVPERRPAFE